MTTSRGASGNSPAPDGQRGLDAWALCAEFVERVLSEAQAAVSRDNSGRAATDVDWARIWQAGEGAASDELAIGRIIRTASEVAQSLTQASSAPVDQVSRAGDGGGRVPKAAVATVPGPPTSVVEPVIVPVPVAEPAEPPIEPPTSVVEPVVVPVEQVAEPAEPPIEPPTSVVEPVVVPVEQVAEPAQPPTEPPTSVVEPVVVPVLQPVAEPVAPHEPPPDASGTKGSVAVAGVAGAAGMAALTLDQPDHAMTAVVEPIAPEAPALAPEGAEAAEEPRRRRRRATRTTPEKSHSTWFSVFTWVRNIGIVVLLFVAWQLWGTAIAQHQAQDQLKSQFDSGLKSHHAPPQTKTGSGPALIPASTNFPSPADGSVVARLQIPSIGVDQYVVSGTSDGDLSKGPGHYVGTALPGQAGNVAIAGHRTTHGAPFNGLGRLVRGDRIVLTTTWGQHLTYVVTGAPQAVSPSDVAVLSYFGDNRVTLTTCNPEFSSTQRLVAVGELKAGPAAPPSSSKAITYHVVDPSTASWDVSLLPVVGIEVCILLLLGLSYRRFDLWFGRAGKWFILVPVWAALLYLLFGTLTTFLPSSI